MGCSFFDGWKVSNVNRPGCPMPILPQNMSSPKNEILTSKVKMVSFVLTALLCVGTLVYGLLPGLLAVFLGYIFAGALVGEGRKKGPRLTPPVAAAVVVLLPIVGLVVLFVNAKGVIFGAFEVDPRVRTISGALASSCGYGLGNPPKAARRPGELPAGRTDGGASLVG